VFSKRDSVFGFEGVRYWCVLGI